MASSSKKLIKKKNIKESNVKIAGGDYSKSIEGAHMRRRDYELYNTIGNSMPEILPLNNVRPFYSVNKYVQGRNEYQQVSHPADTDLEIMKRKVSHSLLVNKPLMEIHDQYNDSDEGQQIQPSSKLKLPKLKNKVTLHITNRGSKLINDPYLFFLICLVLKTEFEQ